VSRWARIRAAATTDAQALRVLRLLARPDLPYVSNDRDRTAMVYQRGDLDGPRRLRAPLLEAETHDA
jgi:hypothetical protein